MKKRFRSLILAIVAIPATALSAKAGGREVLIHGGTQPSASSGASFDVRKNKESQVAGKTYLSHLANEIRLAERRKALAREAEARQPSHASVFDAKKQPGDSLVYRPSGSEKTAPRVFEDPASSAGSARFEF